MDHDLLLAGAGVGQHVGVQGQSAPLMRLVFTGLLCRTLWDRRGKAELLRIGCALIPHSHEIAITKSSSVSFSHWWKMRFLWR